MIPESVLLFEDIALKLLKSSLIEDEGGNIHVTNSLINRKQKYLYESNYDIHIDVHINTNYGHFMYLYFEDLYYISRKLDYGNHLTTISNNSSFMFCYYPRTFKIYEGTLSDNIIDFFTEYNIEYATDITCDIEFYAKLKGLW